MKWQDASAELCKLLGQDIWDSWISKLELINYDSKKICLGAPNNFITQWVQNNYADVIRTVTGLDVIILVHNNLSETRITPHTPTLNKSFSFENFVIGPPNFLTFEIIKRLSVSYPDVPYTPTYIYGQAGVGKTHLMHALGWKLSEAGASVLYLSSGQFLDRFIQSIRERNVQAFSSDLISYDAILIDDFQFLIGKEKTQEEFFNILNTIVEARKIIVISADQPPSEFSELHDRMKSRLGGGMITTVHPPDYELKVSLLKTWEPSLSPEMLDLMAKLEISIRELKGALMRVTVQAGVMNMAVNTEFASSVLHDLMTPSGFAPSMDEILNALISYVQKNMTKITKEQIRMSGRSSHVALLRQIFMYLSHEIGAITLSRIGAYLNNRDRTTVRHGIIKIKTSLKSDRNIQEIIHGIKTILGV